MNQIFNIKINIMENVNLDIIEDIENKLFNKESLSANELDYFLSYVTYKTRYLIVNYKKENIENYGYNFMCDTAQSMIARYFDELNVVYKPVETQKAITSDILGHSFLTASFMVEGEFRHYIIDPTYNQFFDINKCSENNFKVINGVVLKTPDLGYFALKSDDNVQAVVKTLLRQGYIEETLENTKVYGDLFYKTKTGSVNYFNANLEMPGMVYAKGFEKSDFKLTYSLEDLKKMGLFLEPMLKNNFNLKK